MPISGQASQSMDLIVLPMPAAEGLPLLDVNGLTPVNSRPVNDLSFRNGGVNMLTPLTDSEISTPASDYLFDYPTMPCSCGCGDYWLTDWNRWLCSRCHPKPKRMVRHPAISA